MTMQMFLAKVLVHYLSMQSLHLKVDVTFIMGSSRVSGRKGNDRVSLTQHEEAQQVEHLTFLHSNVTVRMIKFARRVADSNVCTLRVRADHLVDLFVLLLFFFN